MHEGERVKAGQPLVKISADLVSASMGDTHAVVRAQLRAQQAQIRTTLANLRPQVKEQARDLRIRIGLLLFIAVVVLLVLRISGITELKGSLEGVPPIEASVLLL